MAELVPWYPPVGTDKVAKVVYDPEQGRGAATDEAIKARAWNKSRQLTPEQWTYYAQAAKNRMMPFSPGRTHVDAFLKQQAADEAARQDRQQRQARAGITPYRGSTAQAATETAGASSTPVPRKATPAPGEVQSVMQAIRKMTPMETATTKPRAPSTAGVGAAA